MTDVLKSLWSWNLSSVIPIAEDSSKKWSHSIEKRITTSIHNLKLMGGDRKEAKLAVAALTDLLPHLEIDAFNLNSTDEQFNHARKLMLDLWNVVLINIDKLSQPSELSVVTRVIVAIIKRKEFDMAHLALDIHHVPHCSDADMAIAHRYRVLLYNTQAHVNTKLSEKDLGNGNNIFVAKVLAVNYFRIPGCRQALVHALTLDETALTEAKAKADELGIEGLRGGKETDTIQREITQVSAYPVLFQWGLYHSVLLNWRPDNEDGKLRLMDSGWTQVLSKREQIFFLFLKEWIDHIRTVAFDKNIEWKSIPGYSTFLQVFLYCMMKSKNGFTKSVMDASYSILLTDISLINPYLRFIFSTTNAYDTVCVIDTLSTMDNWFKELMNAKQQLTLANFDYQYFQDALEVVFNTEHHLLTSRVLSSLFIHAAIFSPELRRLFYGEFLLKKFFFRFFLHWDSGVRNSFQQIIIFKVIRTKRSLLRQVGFSIGEISSRHSLTKSQNDLHASPDYAIDLLLFGKIESYLQMVTDQLRHSNSSEVFPKTMEVYAPKSLSEYKVYLSRYFQWEGEGSEPPLKPIPISMLQPPQTKPVILSPVTVKRDKNALD